MVVSYDLRLTVGGILQKLGLGCCSTSLGTPLGALSLSLFQASQLWASFPMYSLKEKDVVVCSAENYAHLDILLEIIFTPFLTV